MFHGVILSWLKYYRGVKSVFHFISSLSIPPELYCTRWIRLMFSREVKGLHHVMILWDSFFRLVSSISKKEHVDKPNDSSTNNLMNILETAAAAMILMLKVDLIRPHAQRYKIYDDDRDPNDCIHLLMNYPPIESASNLVKIIEETVHIAFVRDIAMMAHSKSAVDMPVFGTAKDA